MADTFRIDDTGMPWAGDRRYFWASHIRNEEHRYGNQIVWYRGFTLTFENGWTLSIQWGWANYCRDYGQFPGDWGKKEPVEESPDAEIAAWDMDGKWYDFGLGTTTDGTDVLGYQTVTDVYRWIEFFSQQPSRKDDDDQEVRHSSASSSDGEGDPEPVEPTTQP
jgi:hypothetical protein